MDKLCCHNKICHQNLSLISRLQTINKQAASPTVALCSVVQEIKAELLFSFKLKWFFYFYSYFILPNPVLFLVIVHISSLS